MIQANMVRHKCILQTNYRLFVPAKTVSGFARLIKMMARCVDSLKSSHSPSVHSDIGAR